MFNLKRFYLDFIDFINSMLIRRKYIIINYINLQINFIYNVIKGLLWKGQTY